MVVLIEPRGLIRECLARCLCDMANGAVVVSFPTIGEWQEAAGSQPDADVVLLCVSRQGTEIEQDSTVSTDGWCAPCRHRQ